MGPCRKSLQYGGEDLRAASRLLAHLAPGSVLAAEPLRGRRLDGIRATALLLTSLPRLRISLTDSPAGRRLHEHFGDRIFGIRHSLWAQGVLALPEQDGSYLRGRSRQAVRTGIRQAQAEGIVCRALHGVEERRTVLQHLDMAKSAWDEDLLSLQGDVWRAAFAPGGVPVALARVTVDVEVALLQTFVADHLASRYLLHTELIDTLVGAQVRYLAVNGPMAPLLEPGLQYWQRLLGYRVANLSLSRVAASPRLQPGRESWARGVMSSGSRSR